MQRGEQQRLARARHVRRAALERGRREHVDVRLGEPAREVAPARGRGDHSASGSQGCASVSAPRAGGAPPRCRPARARTARPARRETPPAPRAPRPPPPAAPIVAGRERGRLRLLPGRAIRTLAGTSRTALQPYSGRVNRVEALRSDDRRPATAFVPSRPGDGPAPPCRTAAIPSSGARSGGSCATSSAGQRRRRGAVSARWRRAYRAAYLVVTTRRPRRTSRRKRFSPPFAHRPLRPPPPVRPLDAPDRREPGDRPVPGAGAATRGRHDRGNRPRRRRSAPGAPLRRRRGGAARAGASEHRTIVVMRHLLNYTPGEIARRSTCRAGRSSRAAAGLDR